MFLQSEINVTFSCPCTHHARETNFICVTRSRVLLDHFWCLHVTRGRQMM